MKYLLFILIVFTGFVRAQNPMAGSGNCLVLNGQTDYINLDQPTFNNYSLPMSITAWVRVEALTIVERSMPMTHKTSYAS